MLDIKITRTTSPKEKPQDETKLGFGKKFTDHMFVMDYTEGEELKKFVAAAHPLGVTVVEDHYDPQEFYTAVQGLEQEPERGSRCTVCYRLRMRRAAQYAAEHGFDWFTTTLSISPHKDARRINEIGQQLEEEFGVKHLPSDFKKHNGYLRSLQLSEEYGLYRQDYCGCEFSARARGL